MRKLAPLAVLLLAACGETSTFDFSKTQGPDPVLVAPEKQSLPTVNIANAEGWPDGKQPVAAEGLSVNAFAREMEHVRTVTVLPNGDVLAVLSDAPGTDKTGGPIKGTIMGAVMKRAGSHEGSPNRIMLLRDGDGDGVAETQAVFLDRYLNSPFGLVYANGELFIANATELLAIPYEIGDLKITHEPRLVTELTSGYNHHWTKSLLASPDGGTLYVGVGSNSNIAENGMAMEKERAAIWQIDAKTGAHSIYASGLRNPVEMDWRGETLWTVVNERDALGNDLVPDYLTSVRKGAFYGWPWSYFGQNVDERVKPARPDMVKKAIAPDYALGSHVAPLGLTFSDGLALGEKWSSGAFIGEHGSWNRKPWSGYRVSYVPFNGARPDPKAKPIDVLTGFRVGDIAYGRPVGLAVAKDGSLLVADDVGNVVWRVSRKDR